MSTHELLNIQPQELQFPFELRKQISCSLQLSNKTDNYVAFKALTTTPKNYTVRPNTGIVLPRSTCDVIVTMQAQKEAPPGMQCKDKFLFQSVVASPRATAKDITRDMFNKESGHHVEEFKLRVLYVVPPRPPSPVREGSEEDSSPRASVSENGHLNASEFPVPKAFNERVEPQETSSEVLLKNSLGNIPKRMAVGHTEEEEAQEPEIFSYKVIVAAANFFHPENKVGKGAFESVYKGMLEDGRDIAVKKLAKKSDKGMREFMREVKLLATLKHPNVVKLVGYAVASDSEPLLVYEYVAGMTLEEYLQRLNSKNRLKDKKWRRRYEIIKGIAEGLKYIHGGSQNGVIIHRNIQPSNILIDHKRRPIIAGFGHAYQLDKDETHVFTHEVGSTREEYIDPNYWKYGYLAKQVDIYSFGILVLKLVSDQRSRRNEKVDNAVDLADLAYKLCQGNRILKFMDPTLEHSTKIEEVTKCARIGLLCVQGDPRKRPDIDDVLSMLTGNMDITERRIGKPGLLEEHEVEKLKKGPNNCEEFLYETLSNATNNFDSKIGGGGFGDVYKGKLEDGRDIAVKKSNRPNSFEKQYTESILMEIRLLTRVKHDNVVKLFGYCSYDGTYLLVYEYVPNESLDKYLPSKSPDNLFGSKGRGQQLDWTRRFGIIKGIANGLSHLHANHIVHRDIKPENVLLDNQWKPKVGDFGISRLFDVDRTHISTKPKGTDEYIAPEYREDERLTYRSDVYSFGIVMLEIISGTRLKGTFKRDNGKDLLDWAYNLFKADKTFMIMDPALKNLANLQQVTDCIIIALRCVQGNPYLRPHMEEVVSMLTNQVQLNKSIEDPGWLGFAYYKFMERRKHDDSLREF